MTTPYPMPITNLSQLRQHAWNFRELHVLLVSSVIQRHVDSFFYSVLDAPFEQLINGRVEEDN
jgi:hypothetical protein